MNFVYVDGSKNTYGIFRSYWAAVSNSEQFWVKRARTTNGEIGPVACQNYETWNCLIFVT